MTIVSLLVIFSPAVTIMRELGQVEQIRTGVLPDTILPDTGWNRIVVYLISVKKKL